MSKKLLAATLLNVCAILVPTAALYAHYGPFERIALTGPDAGGHLIALTGTTVASFLIGLLSSTLVRSAHESVTSVMSVLASATTALKQRQDATVRSS